MSDTIGVKLSAVDAASVISTLQEVRDALQKAGASAEQVAASTSKSGQVMTGAFRQIGAIATNALMAAGQAFMGFVSKSVGEAESYEQSMNMLGAVTGASADQMAAAGKLAQALGADLTLPATSAADAGKAMTELAKAGLSVDQAMAAAKGTLQLAAAAGIGEAQAAEIAANALNTFGLDGSKATEVANLLAAAANASSLEVTDAADAFRMAGSVYASFQGPVVGTEQAMIDLTTAMGLLGNAGIKGSDAGTSLKQTLLQLAAPSDKAKGLMKELAESIGESGDIAYNSQGQMRPLREIIELTAKSTAGLTQEQRNYRISTIFGADATRSVLSLIRAGPEAWDKMQAAVSRAGAASDLAGTRMQGLGGSIAGLGSQLETLALEAILPLLPYMTDLVSSVSAFAGSFAGQVGPAVEAFIQILIQVGGFIQTVFVPAVVGATAATIAWAIANSATLLPALGSLVTSVVAATGAIIAQAGALLLAAAPYIAIGAAIGGVVLAYNSFNDKVKEATQSLLESKPFWNDSTQALKDFSEAGADVQTKYGALADAVKTNRQALEGEIESLGRRMAAGLVSEEQYNSEMETINRQAAAVKASSDELEGFVKAEVKAQAASSTGTEKLQDLAAGHAELGDAVDLSAKDLEKLQKALEKTYEDGGKAVEAYVNTSIEFLDKLTQAQKAGNDEQTANLAKAYAEQAAAQRAHLGSLLTDYTVAQQQLGNISREQADTILGAITKQFGTTESVSAQAFLNMTAQIDAFAKSGGGSADELGKHLEGVAQNAIDTKTQMEALAKKYVAELVENFEKGKLDANELRTELEKIPAKVYSEVTITNRTIFIEEHRKTEHAGEQFGGPVEKGRPYVVGEKRPEVFVPTSAGRIYPSIDAFAQAFRSPASPQAIINLSVPPPQVIIMQPANTSNSTTNIYGAPQPSGSRGQRANFDAGMALYGSRG